MFSQPADCLSLGVLFISTVEVTGCRHRRLDCNALCCIGRRLGHPPSVSPQVVGSHVLGQLLQRAANYLGHSQVSKAVIAIPAKFDARQKAATVEAFHLAGLQVQQYVVVSSCLMAAKSRALTMRCCLVD